MIIYFYQFFFSEKRNTMIYQPNFIKIMFHVVSRMYLFIKPWKHGHLIRDNEIAIKDNLHISHNAP